MAGYDVIRMGSFHVWHYDFLSEVEEAFQECLEEGAWGTYLLFDCEHSVILREEVSH